MLNAVIFITLTFDSEGETHQNLSDVFSSPILNTKHKRKHYEESRLYLRA